MPTAGALIKAYGGVQQASADATDTTASTSYTDLAGGAGPTLNVDLALGQSVLIIIEAEMQVSGAGATAAIASVEVAGPSTSDLAAADTNSIESGVVTEWVPGTKHTLFTASSAGTHAITVKYKVIGAVTGSFKLRRLTAIPQPI